MAIFDHTHILDGAPVDSYIELVCKKCKGRFTTKNMYFIGYRKIFTLDEQAKRCKCRVKHLEPTGKWWHRDEE